MFSNACFSAESVTVSSKGRHLTNSPISHCSLGEFHGGGVNANIAADVNSAVVDDGLREEGRFKALFGGDNLLWCHDEGVAASMDQCSKMNSYVTS